MIKEPHKAQSFGDRDNFTCTQQAAVGAAHSHQALVKGRLPAVRIYDGLIGEKNAPLVERGDDFIGDAYILAPLHFALEVRLIGEK